MKKITTHIYESNMYYHIRIYVLTPYTNCKTYKIKKNKSIQEIINRRLEIINIWKTALKNTTINDDVIWKYETDYLHENGNLKFWTLI